MSEELKASYANNMGKSNEKFQIQIIFLHFIEILWLHTILKLGLCFKKVDLMGEKFKIFVNNVNIKILGDIFEKFSIYIF